MEIHQRICFQPCHWEFWMNDSDGYIVVVASPDGSADGTWQPNR